MVSVDVKHHERRRDNTFWEDWFFYYGQQCKRGVKTEISFIMNSEEKIYTITRD